MLLAPEHVDAEPAYRPSDASASYTPIAALGPSDTRRAIEPVPPPPPTAAPESPISPAASDANLQNVHSVLADQLVRQGLVVASSVLRRKTDLISSPWATSRKLAGSSPYLHRTATAHSLPSWFCVFAPNRDGPLLTLVVLRICTEPRRSTPYARGSAYLHRTATVHSLPSWFCEFAPNRDGPLLALVVL